MLDYIFISFKFLLIVKTYEVSSVVKNP